jgi:hypothetical protein
MARSTAALSALAGVILAGALVGCVPSTPTPVPTQTLAVPTASSTPSAPAAPVLVEGGTAAENQAYFDKVNLAYFTGGAYSSLGIIDSLVKAGFRKQDMEVTADTTSIDLQVDSRVFSVRLKGQCLIGDVGPTGYTSIVMPMLGTGGCLIGTTLPIP